MKLCMIGTGYVGLVSGVCFSDLGNSVICVDINKEKINKLNLGIVPIFEPGLGELLKKNFNKKNLKFTSDVASAIRKSDIIFICVGTPTSKKNNSADLKYVMQAAKIISKNINKYKLIVTKSTVPVTTGDKIEKILDVKKNKNKFDVISNPEFLREGEAIRDFIFPDRVVIGTDSKKANNIMKSLYSPIVKKSSRYFNSSRRGAELIKYASNAFLATKISYINEMANLCEKAKIDIKDISLGMGLDQRIGERFLRAGPGYGGSCFPKDTRAIVTLANQFKTDLTIIKSVISSNDQRSHILFNSIKSIMGGNFKNKSITFLGVTFKANTDDMRESSSLNLIPQLLKGGALVRYYDPSGIKNNFINFKKVTFFDTINKACDQSDLVIIHTEWNEFRQLNIKKLVNKKNFKVYDMRNMYSPNKMKSLKINYFSIGR